MKRIWIGMLIIIAAAGLAVKPLVLQWTVAALQKNLKTKNVTIKDCRIRLGSIYFQNLNIQKGNVLKISAEGLGVRFSFMSLMRRELTGIDIKELNIDSVGYSVKGASISTGTRSNPGALTMDRASYNKIKLSNVVAKAALEGKDLYVQRLTAQALLGQLKGELWVKLEQNPFYQGRLDFEGLDLNRFERDFEIKDKVHMTGLLSGHLEFQGKGNTLKVLNGSSVAAAQGGVIVIKDERFLRNLARSTQQPMNLVVDSFKDYHYNDGTMQLGLKDNNLMFDLAFSGESGKRNINLVIHDFKL